MSYRIAFAIGAYPKRLWELMAILEEVALASKCRVRILDSESQPLQSSTTGVLLK
jgi:hypothetical protein